MVVNDIGIIDHIADWWVSRQPSTKEKKAKAEKPGPPPPPPKAIKPKLKGEDIAKWCQNFKRLHGRKHRLDETTAAFPEFSRSTCYRRLKAA